MRLALAALISLSNEPSASASQTVGPGLYGALHYDYAGALGDQACADRRADGYAKRGFAARYDARVAAADAWFKRRFSDTALLAALREAYGNADLADARDCLMTSDGIPAYRDTKRFIRDIKNIEQMMKRAD